MIEGLQTKISDQHGNLNIDPAIADMFFSDVQMLILIAQKPIRLNNIAKETGYTAQSVGRHCSRMDRNGLITVKKDRRDKRAKLASITKRGAYIKAICDDFLSSISSSK